MDQYRNSDKDQEDAHISGIKQPETPAGQNHEAANSTGKKRKGVDERIADYTKWLMIGTALLAAATVWLAVSTSALWRYAAEQSHDMKNSIETSKDANRIALDALASDRAWIGATGAMISGEIADDKPLKTTIQFKNSGRSPAKKFTAETRLYVLSAEAKLTEDGAIQAAAYAGECMNKGQPASGMILYPSNDQRLIQTTIDFPASLLQKGFASGEKTAMFQGCITCMSNNIVRHTAFCYWYRKGFTDQNSLNFCGNGNEAD